MRLCPGPHLELQSILASALLSPVEASFPSTTIMSDGVDVFHTPATSNVRLSAAQDLESDPFLDAPPMAPYMASAAITPRSSFTPSTTNSTQLLPLAAQKERSEYAEDPTTPSQPSPKANRRPLLLFALGLIVLGIVVLAVIIPVYFTVIKPKNNHNALKGGSTSNSTSSAGTGTGTGTGNGTEQSSGGDTQNKPTSSVDAVTGGDGSTITMANGQQFTYSNKFSGTCELNFFCKGRQYPGFKDLENIVLHIYFYRRSKEVWGGCYSILFIVLPLNSFSYVSS